MDDFAGDITTKGVLTVGSFAAGNIEVSGDTDWFRVSLDFSAADGDRVQLDAGTA